MDSKKYYLVQADILPEVFHKVILANQLLNSGKATTKNEAARMAGISRSAYYKYRECIREFTEFASSGIITMHCMLSDEAGVLSSVLTTICDMGANILTINQNIPINRVAPVFLSIEPQRRDFSVSALTDRLNTMPGVRDAVVVARQGR